MMGPESTLLPPPLPLPPHLTRPRRSLARRLLPGPSRRQPRIRKGGRPPKAGVDGIPVNVRLSQADHLALAKLSGKLMVPGRPLPTVQDVVRGLIRGALGEPELALRLCRQRDL